MQAAMEFYLLDAGEQRESLVNDLAELKKRGELSFVEFEQVVKRIATISESVGESFEVVWEEILQDIFRHRCEEGW